MITENGWPSCGPDLLDDNPIPGTDERVSFQRGVPNRALKAFAGDLNWYVESVYNGVRGSTQDEGGWTPTNSVATSNHLGGTAMDYNWNDHPMGPQVPDPAAGWQWSEIVGGPEEPRVRELLDYYTFTAKDGTEIQIIWWANDWDSPHDSMHFQMGYGTYEHRDEVSAWLDAHVDPATGFSHFRDFKKSQLPAAADVLHRACSNGSDTDVDMDTIQSILPTFQQGLKLAQCTNPHRIAMFIAQLREESANFQTTTEFGKGAGKPYFPYYGRTWIQITWQSNYAAFGQWCKDQGLVADANVFVANPDSLADMKWAAIGPAWYWTVERPQINAMCDADNITGVTQAINGGQNGIDVRTNYWNQARAVGDDLLALIQEQGDDELSDPNVVKMIQDIHDKMCGGGSMPTLWPSRGMFFLSGEKPGGVDDTVGMLLNTDGNVWNIENIIGALLGVDEDVQRIKDTASGKFPKDSFIAGNEWLQERAVAFAEKLVPICGALNPAAFQQPSATPTKAPAKRARTTRKK